MTISLGRCSFGGLSPFFLSSRFVLHRWGGSAACNFALDSTFKEKKKKKASVDAKRQKRCRSLVGFVSRILHAVPNSRGQRILRRMGEK
jgi:hypothetical protein